jgi:hypothetical protein
VVFIEGFLFWGHRLGFPPPHRSNDVRFKVSYQTDASREHIAMVTRTKKMKMARKAVKVTRTSAPTMTMTMTMMTSNLRLLRWELASMSFLKMTKCIKYIVKSVLVMLRSVDSINNTTNRGGMSLNIFGYVFC